MQTTCPHCHSSNVTSNTDVNSIFEQLCSPAALSALGVSICRYYKVNPTVGAVAGTALATAISTAKAKLIQPPLLVMAARHRSYFCHTCTKTFTL